MPLTYAPGMWATPVDYLQRLAKTLQEERKQRDIDPCHGQKPQTLRDDASGEGSNDNNAELYALVDELSSPHSIQQRKESIWSLDKLARSEHVSQEVRALASLAQACILAEETHIARARAICSQGIFQAMPHLGSLHPLILEMRRWEAQWMCFSMMEDLALKRYVTLLKDITEVVGTSADAYWETRLESLTPLLIKNAHSAFQRKLQRLVNEITLVKGEAYHLSVKAQLWHAQHHIALLDLNRARKIYLHLLEICPLIAHDQQCAYERQNEKNESSTDSCGVCFACDTHHAVRLLLDSLDEFAA